jgi:hypothetical protein
MKNYRSLIVWQKAHAVALEVYRITKQFRSNQEIEYLVLLSCDLDYISQEVHDKLNAEVNKVRAMLIKLISNVRGERETDRKKEN